MRLLEAYANQYSMQYHASSSHKEGLAGLYRGMGPCCLKLEPATGISSMCYEVRKRFLVENEKTIAVATSRCLNILTRQLFCLERGK